MFATVRSTVAVFEPCAAGRVFGGDMERIQTATFWLCLVLSVLAAMHYYSARQTIAELSSLRARLPALEEEQRQQELRLTKVEQKTGQHSNVASSDFPASVAAVPEPRARD